MKMSFAEVGIELEFEGEGVNETARIVQCNNKEYKLDKGQVVLKIDPRYYRPTEVELLIGDPAKAKQKLGWEMEYDLKGLVEDMVSSDLELFKRDKFLLKGGHKVFNYHE